MDWIVQNARNTDVERQHLNKILAEIRASIVKVEGEVKLVVNKSVHDVVGNMLSGEQTGIQVWYDATKSTINFRVPNFTIRLTGDVTGTGTVSALTDVNIVTTLDSDVGIPDAPNTGDAFWRRSQEWEQIPALIESLSSLPDNGILVATDTGITNREIEGPMSVVVTDGDGVAANPSVSLVNDEVSPGFLESYATDMTGTKGWYKPALFESTGLLNGGVLSVNAGDNTKFDISAAVVGHTSYVANPASPTRTVLSIGPFVATTVDDLSATASYIGILMPGGTVVQQTSPYTATQTRTIIPLGAVVSNGTNLIAVNNLPNVIRAGINQIQDFMAAVGPMNISGNKITPNGVNLQLNKSAGVIFKQGSNFNIDPFNPHGLSLASLTAFNFNYRLSDGTQFAATNSIDPSNYEDPLGTLTPVTAANRFTIQRITVFTSNLVRVQYGQFVYNTMAEAESALATEAFVTETNIAENGILLAFLIVQDGATDLSDPAQAKFIPASKFGGPVGTGGTSILNTDALPEGLTNLYFTDARAQSAAVIDSIADADTTHAPSRNAVFDALALKADLASPAFTGNPTAPTPLTADNDTSIATTAFVKAQGYGTGSVTSVNATNTTGITWSGVPITGSGSLVATLSANLQAWHAISPTTKADLASPVFTGNPTAPTPSPGDNDTSLATTAFVTAADAALIIDSIADADTTHAPSRNAVFDALALKADLASPTFTGDPKAPTPLTADNDTSIATTAFVKAQGYVTNSILATTIVNGDTTHAPDGNSVFDALAAKQGNSLILDAIAVNSGSTTSDDLLVSTGFPNIGLITHTTNTFPAKGSTGGLVPKPITDFGLALVALANASAVRTALEVASGTYTPTFTGVTNVTTIAAASDVWMYSRQGDIVAVNGQIVITPTVGTPTLTQARISLPIASNLQSATNEDCSGTGTAGSGTTQTAAFVRSDTVNNEAFLQFPAPGGATATPVRVAFTYRIRV